MCEDITSILRHERLAKTIVNVHTMRSGVPECEFNQLPNEMPRGLTTMLANYVQV